MRPFRFAHAADLHIDSPFRGLRDVDKRVSRRPSRRTRASATRAVAGPVKCAAVAHGTQTALFDATWSTAPDFNPVCAAENAPVKIRRPSNYMTYEIIIHRARVLSCPTRLDVWQCIGQFGMYAGDIARTSDVAPSTVSHHLAVLEHAGLVRHRQQGRYRWYESTGVRWGVVSEDEFADAAAG